MGNEGGGQSPSRFQFCCCCCFWGGAWERNVLRFFLLFNIWLFWRIDLDSMASALAWAYHLSHLEVPKVSGCY